MKRCLEELDYKETWWVEWIKECCEGLDTWKESMSTVWIV